MMKAAELEILIAECFNAQSKELEKIYSFKRATELYLGMLVEPSEYQKQEYFTEDVHSTMTKISPYLINMLLDQMKNSEVEVQIAALRGIEFLLEKMGCTLDSFMIDILKAIVTIYPSKKLVDSKDQPSSSQSGSFPAMVISNKPSSKLNKKEVKNQDLTKSNERGT